LKQFTEFHENRFGGNAIISYLRSVFSDSLVSVRRENL